MTRICSFITVTFLAFGVAACDSEEQETSTAEPVADAISQVLRAGANELILKQEVSFAAPIEDVWRAYSTAEGWTAWAAPKAEIDLRIGGTIRTAYQGEIGSSSTNTLHIVNYVPERLLTLRAEPSPTWPEVMQKDADKLSNVILFDEIEDGVTRIQSFGIGYSDAPEYEQLMGFFIKANESLYQNLRTYLETGVPVKWGE